MSSPEYIAEAKAYLSSMSEHDLEDAGDEFQRLFGYAMELSLALTAEAEHAAQLRKALIAARSHIDNLHGEIGRRTYQQEELEVTTAFDGLGDGQFNGDWASIMGIIDAAMEKANG